MKIRRLTTAKGEDRGRGRGRGEAAQEVEVSMGYLLTYWWWAGVKEVGGRRYVNCGCSHINKLRSSQNVCRCY